MDYIVLCFFNILHWVGHTHLLNNFSTKRVSCFKDFFQKFQRGNAMFSFFGGHVKITKIEEKTHQNRQLQGFNVTQPLDL